MHGRVALAVEASSSGHCKPHPTPVVGAVAERLGVMNADWDSGIWTGDSRDEELCRIGVELLPAGVHSGEHPVPNHCWSSLFFLA